MQHGTDQYFLEYARFTRRVSMLSTAVGMAFLGLFGITLLPSFPPYHPRLMRSGFEGADRYAPIVHLDVSAGEDEPLLNVGKVQPIATKGGGGADPVPAAHA